MCRFLAYHGPSTSVKPWLLDSSNSLVTQSRFSKLREEPANEDGFGLGWYPDHDDPEPGTFVSIEPAWSNRNLKQLAAKLRSPLFFAHVRDASKGMPVSQANCHPFQYGPWLWMHNGFLENFAAIRRKLLATLSDQAFNMVRGNTDSEHAFALFLDEINFAPEPAIETVITALENTIEKIAALCRDHNKNNDAHMNFGLSNGNISLFTRFNSNPFGASPPSLFYNENQDSGKASIMVASEPVSNEPGWHAVAENRTLVIQHNSLVSTRQLEEKHNNF